MNGKTAKLLNRIAAKAKRPRAKFKTVWRNTPRSERAQLRHGMERELGLEGVGRARLTPDAHRELQLLRARTA